MSAQPEQILKINQRIEVIAPGRKGLLEHYSSRVEEINNNNLVIAMPMRKGVPVILRSKEVIYIRVVADFAAYEFTSTFIDKQMNPLPVWIIATPYNKKKIQQRSFVRLDTSLPVQVRTLVDGKVVETPPFNACTKDISGGGAQIVVTHSYAVGTRLMVTIELLNANSITVPGEVIRVQQPQADRTVYWLAVKFIEVSKKDRDNIIKFIFKKQLEQRRKEL